ncbi:hypothetical protein BJV82DRAFT_197519 [Fennellomyces sp. T-0311]|nr:hypothetical protein BJV82DRAFT_197519 [Fennellomyces sp. T-0311]
MFYTSSTLKIDGSEFNRSISLSEGWLRDLFMVLRWWSLNTFETLVIKDVNYISDSTAHWATKMLQSIHPPFKHVLLDPSVNIPACVVIPILESCSRAKHISFASTVNRDPVFGISFCGREILVSYLELAEGFLLGPLADIFLKCPNLVHLVLSCKNTSRHIDYAKRALEYCPKLRILDIGRDPSQSKNIKRLVSQKSHTNTEAFSIVATLPTESPTCPGLHILKYWGRVEEKSDDFPVIIDSTYKSLQSLHYTNGYLYGLPSADLSVLASYGAPKLRTVHFKLGLQTYDASQGSILLYLIGFFANTCSLEEIVLDFGYDCSKDNPEPETANELLLTITKNCGQLRRLTVIDGFRYTGNTMMEFAAGLASNRLTHLEICMDPERTPAFVKKIVTLLYFQLMDGLSTKSKSTATYSEQMRFWSYRNTIDTILYKRRIAY